MSAFKNTVVEKINLIRLPEVIDKDSVKIFEASVPVWTDLPVEIHVFDFSNVVKLNQAIYAPFVKFKKESNVNQIKVISVNLRPEISQQVISHGVNNAIGQVKDIKSLFAKKQNDTKSDVMASLIRYFVNTAKESLTAMFNMSVNCNESYKEAATDFSADRFFRSSRIDVNCKTITARLNLYIEKPCLEGLVFEAFKEPVTESNSDLMDSVAGELLNIIYGSSKSKLNNDRGYDLPPAIPRMVPINQALTDRKDPPKERFLIQFSAPVGQFILEINVTK